MTKKQNISEISQELKQLRDENKQLKAIVKQYLDGDQQRSISDEEAVCMTQIKFIREISYDRELTLEEAKKLDIFIKNLKLIRGEIVEVSKVSKVDRMTNQKLIELAELVDSE